MLKHIMSKFLKTKDQEKILREAQEKHLTYSRKKLQCCTFLYLSEIFFRNHREIEIFLSEAKL